MRLYFSTRKSPSTWPTEIARRIVASPRYITRKAEAVSCFGSALGRTRANAATISSAFALLSDQHTQKNSAKCPASGQLAQFVPESACCTSLTQDVLNPKCPIPYDSHDCSIMRSLPDGGEEVRQFAEDDSPNGIALTKNLTKGEGIKSHEKGQETVSDWENAIVWQSRWSTDSR
jgi:hypothetical protein